MFEVENLDFHVPRLCIKTSLHADVKVHRDFGGIMQKGPFSLKFQVDVADHFFVWELCSIGDS